MKLRQKLTHLASQNMRRVCFYLFPLFLNLVLYCNLTPSPSLASRTPRFSFDLPGVLRFLLALLLIFIGYVLLTILTRRPWLAALVLSVPLYVISMVDYYKYYALGTRISLDDIIMVFSLHDLWTPQGAAGNGMFFSPLLLVTFPLLCLYIHFLRVLRVGDAVRFHGRRVICGALAMWCLLTFSTNSLAYQIFDPQLQAYSVVPSSRSNAPRLTSIDCLIGSVYYDEFTDERATEDNVQRLLSAYEPQAGTGVRPDILVVMSESYFDLRRVDGLEVDDSLYQNFRRMQSQGCYGRVVVPAFGGGTASSEFEVLSGTSNAALQGTRSPYAGISSWDTLPSFREYFGNEGYDCTYVHPFKGSFYNRANAFAAMGFDRMLFQEDLTVPVEEYSRDIHISDATLTQQLIALLEEETDDPQFIWATSMQNHSPYVTMEENDPWLIDAPEGVLREGELDGLRAYAVGIRDTDQALGQLLDYIDSREKPTALLFFGDHQPLLEGYKKLNGIETDTLYEDLSNLTTDYAIYTNYQAPLTSIDGSDTRRTDRPFSACYLMDVYLTALGMPKDSYLSFLDDAFRHLPVYSLLITQEEGEKKDVRRCRDALDILSYDRAMGEHYSSQIQ